jgi:hypothetical protein
MNLKMQTCLKKFNIHPEVYHGGDLNGVCSRSFMTEAQSIFDELLVIFLDVDDEWLQTREITREEFENVVSAAVADYKDMFRLMDAAFSSLRTINPTLEECDEAQRRVDKVLVKWRAMDISITPKVHIIEDHTVPQMRYHGGIGDKGEDFVEASHQNGKREHRRTGRVIFFKKRHNCAQKNEYINNDPAIQDQIFAVNNSKRRKLTREVSLSETRDAEKKAARDDGRREVCSRY